jgi:hypothetical protein
VGLGVVSATDTTLFATVPADIEALDEAVRDQVRRNGVDPLTDVGAVRGFAESAVRAHDERSLSGVVLPLPDPGAVVEELIARVAGFGPLQRYLDDPAVEEVWINRPDRVFVAREGRHELTTTVLTTAQVRDLVERMLKTSGRRVDLSEPFVDALLPGGHRLHVVLDGIARDHAAVNIRKFVVRASHLDELVVLGTLTRQAAAFLEAAVIAGLNIVVCGGTQAGKTTMLNSLGGSVPGRERIVSVEEVFEFPLSAILHTCEHSCTSVNHSTGMALARPSTGSVRTARSYAPSATGRSCTSTSTTTCRRRARSRALRIGGCSQPLSVVRLRSSLPGTSTG